MLREVESDMRGTDEWISAANETLAQPISAAVLRGHRAVVTALVFDLEAGLLYSADGAGEVWRWDLSTAKGRRLHVHEGEVTSLALSPDAGVLISGSRDGELRAWTPEEGSTTLARYPEGITTVVFSEGGERVAVGVRDGKVRMYAGQGTLDLERELGVGSLVYAVAFDGAGERLLTGSKDGRGRVWSLADGELLATLEGHTLGVFYAAFIDADELVTASDDNQVSYWKLAGDGGPPTRRLVVKHRRAVSAFALRGRELLSGSVSGEVLLTKLDPEGERDGFASTLVSKHGDDVRFVDFHGQESLVSVGFDAIAQAQPVDLRAPATVMRGHRSAILSAAHSGRWLATGAWDGAVRVWDLEQPGADRVLDGHNAKIFDLAVDRAGERVATAAHDGTVRVWRIRDGALLHEFDGIDRIVNAVAFSPDGRSLASAGKLGVTLWSLEDGSVRELGGHNQAWVVDFDARGERLVSVGSDRLVRIWDLATGESRALSGHEGRVFEAAFRPGGAELATASDDGSVRVWGADSGDVIARLPEYDPTVLAMLAWSPDGSVLAASAQDGGAWLWGSADLLWGAEQPTPTLLRERGARVRALAFDARSQRLATGSDDGVVRVWALDSGDLVQRLSGHAEPVSALAFADSGRALVSGSWDSTVRFWDLDAGRALILTGHGEEVNDVVVSASTRMLVSASADGSARTWDLSRMERSPEALAQALGAATRACLPAEQRVRELGEDEQSARLAQYGCERE
ncbi:WD-40 repeat [Plesiocystis pacifica SIR-1]|uniref:WD-40 repeat n=1 Tax=Plesiocystis pacifica SIR-1 TaxID=391625 RepID=A6GB08_9BACT|nr:WD-40 repeat [Plesiocystis pacifica SIR-1]